MNNISLFLYFAEVFSSLRGVSGVASLAGGFVLLGSLFTSAVTYEDFKRRGEDCADYYVYIAAKKVVKWSTIILSVSAFLLVFLPPRETFYLIAGSEIGETVVTSPEAQAILNDIREVIQAQLQELKGEK